MLRVPFVDMLTAMTQPELPLTAHEYGEWGDVRTDQLALETVRLVSIPQGMRSKVQRENL